MTYPMTRYGNDGRKCGKNVQDMRVITRGVVVGMMMSVVSAQTVTPSNPMGSVCKFVYHRAATQPGTMYVDGGSYYDNYFNNKTRNPSGAFPKLQNEFLWKVDLTSSWPYDKPKWANEAKPLSHSEHYNGYQGTMWAFKDGSIYTINGELELLQGPPPGALFGPPLIENNVFKLPSRRLFKYTPGTPGTWSGKDVPTTIPKVTKAAWASSKTHDMGYVLGGMVLSEQFTIPTSGVVPQGYTNTIVDSLIMYNASSDKWDMVKNPTGLGPVIDGMLLPLDELGDSGALVFFGGDTSINTQMRDMSQIWIFDVANRKWYKQQTSGTTPAARRAACAVMVPAPDRSSYQIYMYGGTNFQSDLKDMHVLSIPSFVWLKVPAQGLEWPPVTWDHACSLHRTRQMLIVPGDGPTSGCGGNNTINVFDTVDWVARSTFDPSPARNVHAVPAPIIDLVGGNSTGGATRKVPLGGKFDEPDLAALFTKTPKIPETSSGSTPTSTGGGGLPTESGKGKSDGSKSEKGSNVAGIVGGVVGGLVGIALIVAGIFFWRKRKNASRSAAVELEATRDLVSHNRGYQTSPYHDNSPSGPSYATELGNTQDQTYYKPRNSTTVGGGGSDWTMAPPTEMSTGDSETYHSQRTELYAGAIPQELGVENKGEVSGEGYSS